MRTRVTLALIEEARRHSLRWACEHCAHFDRAADACANGWPNEEHRAARMLEGAELSFCKEFEG